MSADQKPKLTVLLSRFPFPLEKGDKLRAYYQLIELSESHQITLICLSDRLISEEERKELLQYCSTIHIFILPKWKSLWGAFKALIGSKPLQIGYFYNTSIKQKILQILSNDKPDHIYCQLVRAAEYVKDYHDCPKTLDYMDAFSKGIERRIQIEPFYKRWLYRLESKRLKQYEREIYDYFELHSIISEQDANLLGTNVNQSLFVVPNGVSQDFLNYSSSEKAEFDIVFVGNLNYPPNVLAVNFILDEILPKANSLGKHWTFITAGADPTKEIIERFSKLPNASLRNNIKDIREGYQAGKVFVAPMQIGTGLQNKLLEAMALGIPCVTTTLANNALQAKENEEIKIANTSTEFVRAIQELLDDQMNKEIGQAGKTFVRKNFNWSHSLTELRNAMLKA